MRSVALLLALLFAATPLHAQPIVASDTIDAISVTVYRDPDRGQEAIEEGWPGGYALVTETRTLSLPAGRSVIRFVGVSEGMMPETAIVTGLPRRVNEKNRDARLLSPAALIDAYLKRRVTIRRTDIATGKVTTGEAIIQSGPGGGVVLTTPDGVEALGCSGLAEGLSYAGVPEGLSAKPTLSVVTDNDAPATVKIQLSYLAQGFDWQANYVVRVAEGGDTLDLFAWMTLVNGGSQGFAAAATNAVAGELHKERAAALPRGPAPELHLQCWPMDNTSTHPLTVVVDAVSAEDVGALPDRSVTEALQRVPGVAMNRFSGEPVMTAAQEDLGDLKLYRIPEPVTVAAQSQKQVAMIDKRGVGFERFYQAEYDVNDTDMRRSAPAQRVLRTENLDARGLGLPMPAGGVAVFEEGAHGPLLVGETTLADRAVGDEVEIHAGESNDVRYLLKSLPPSGRRQAFTVTVTNARPTPETFEYAFAYKLASASAPLIERKGRKVWRVTVPANGEAKLDFAVKLARRR